jgi:hypothetical protein
MTPSNPVPDGTAPAQRLADARDAVEEFTQLAEGDGDLVDELLSSYAATRDAEVRAAAFREAADLIDVDDDCECGGCDSCTARKDADLLRARADEISGHSAQAGGEQA